MSKKMFLAGVALAVVFACLGSDCPEHRLFGIELIVFHSLRGGGDYGLFTMNAAGTDVQQVPFSAPGDRMFPDIRTDGRIVYSWRIPGVNRLTLATVLPDGSDPVTLSLPPVLSGDCYLPRWSPDGRKIVFSHFNGSTRDIWEINADGSNPVQITSSQFDELSADYSPAGTEIIFESNRDGDVDIYRCRAGQLETNVVQLVNSPGLDFGPTFNPDGSRFCFVSLRSGQYEIWRATASGASQTQITNLNAPQTLAPRYANISRILFMSSVSGNFEIYAIDDTGANLTQLTNDPAVDGFPSSK